MSNTSNPSDDLSELRRQARLNQLRLKIARQNEALSTLRRSGHRDTLEGYYDPANYFDPRDYLFETPRFAGAVPSTLNDRDEGRNYPIFRTEQDLALIRGAARWLTASNPIALGVLTSLTNYVIGNGFQYAATARSAAGKQLAATANDVIDEFLDENDWSGDLDRELFQRSRIDGEYFLGLWHIGGGHVQARTIEPDQVTEPTNPSGLEEWLGCSRRSGLWPDGDGASNANSGQRPDLRADGFVSNWGFGVHTHEVDAQAVHGFYVQWSNRDTDWDYFPGGNEPIVPPGGAGMWLEHAKLNVVRSVKRGLSDFYPIDGNLELARRVLRNMGEGSAVQAAIAWIQEVAPGTTQAQVHSGTLSRADGSYTTLTQQGSRAHATQHYDPATILKVPSGQKYLPGPLGTQHAPNFITAAEALLRTVALRWNLPENLITGSAANNNFASSLVAETPFVKYAESQQQFYAQRDRKTLWRVLRFAWQAGRFGDAPWNAVKRSLDVTVTPPQVEVRDPEKETRVRQMLHEAGILSRKTWSAQESLDFDQEQKNLDQEAAEAKEQPVGGTHGSERERASHGNPQTLAESLEEWDASKHPRGGNPKNAGEFSKAPGGKATVATHADVGTKGEANPAVSKLGDSKVASTSYLPSDLANRLVKRWIDSTSLSDRTKRILANVNNILNLKQEEILPFAQGIIRGFFADGFWGTLVGIKDLGSLAGRAAIQANPIYAFIYAKLYGEQPLAPEGEAVAAAAKQIAAALPALRAFAEEVASGGSEFLEALLKGDAKTLAKYSQLARDIGEFAGDLLLDVVDALTDVDAETRGRVLGFVLYQVAEAMATAGTSAALKAEAACTAARALAKSDLLKNYPKVVASLQKSIKLITEALRINICFVAGTPVHTPLGLVPIEAIRADDLVLTRPEGGSDQANVVRRVTETAITHPIELLRVELQTPTGPETLRCTPGHPFFVIGQGRFVAAENLAVGDRLALADGGSAAITDITHEHALPGECFTTYNFAVEDCHTYFVGRAAVWVHNAGGVCSELSSIYRRVLRNNGKTAEAVEAVVDRLAQMLQKLGADIKAIEAELAKSKIPGITPKQLLEKARARIAASNLRPTLLSVPSVRDGEFQRWFNKLTPNELRQVLSDPALKKQLMQRLRSPGGFHEWLPVSRVAKFKEWGVTAEQIHQLRTPTGDIFLKPIGKHGGKFSTTAHKQIFKLIDESNDFPTFVRKLRAWADQNLVGGASSLPPELRP